MQIAASRDGASSNSSAVSPVRAAKLVKIDWPSWRRAWRLTARPPSARANGPKR